MRAAIGLGSNKGRPEHNLLLAARALEHVPGVSPVALSSGYWTEPIGPAQPRFLNAALLVDSRLEPAALMAALLGIEAALGRRRGLHQGPRVIDLDLLLVEGRVVEDEWLILPHPRLRERAFALVPLLEIWPGARDPATGEGLEAVLARLGTAGVGSPHPLPSRVGRTDLDHTADLAFRVTGRTLGDALEAAALALVDLMADRSKVVERSRHLVEATGPGPVDLLVGLLGELVFRLDARRLVPRRVSLISLEPTRAQLAVYGEELRDEGQLRERVKAVTYHEAAVEKQGRSGRWSATVVLDV